VTPPPVTALRGTGPAIAGRLRKLGIVDLRDLLLHLPLRYQDRCTTVPFGKLIPGAEVAVEGMVIRAEMVRTRRRALLVELSDGDDVLRLRFFHFYPALRQTLRPGSRVRCFGMVRPDPRTKEMIHPEIEAVGSGTISAPGHLTAVYPSTEGVSQVALRNLIEGAFDLLARGEWSLPDWLPDELVPHELRIGTVAALDFLHRPPRGTNPALLNSHRNPARTRLAFEELLAQQLGLARVRCSLKRNPAPILSAGRAVLGPFLDSLPFALTAAQSRIIEEIRNDLASSGPMLRLVQGDVGSGKTVVAAAACLLAAKSGHQAAVMAPTELLAEQHLRCLREWLEPLGLSLALLSGRQPRSERNRVLETLSRGEVDVVSGTHALIQAKVAIPNLGLAVIDEQHRFGVHQRLALGNKGRKGGPYPHQLVMTATPIPRTLAMTAYADLDHSVLSELPPGRKPVNTVAVPETRRDEIISRIGRACEAGRQAYWVCTLVEESEALGCRAAEETARVLSEALPKLTIGLVHGRMRAAEKDDAVRRFRAGELQVLVATTVIEVGVDVPNASLMIIENPERLGLAQLHQIRGRIGRGKLDGDCVLLYGTPLSESARERIRTLREHSDGFEIARIDLRLRGPGEVLGTRQTGSFPLRIADFEQDRDLIQDVTRVAREIAASHPAAVDGLIERWIGEGDRFGRA
jgi:ATP-dependent DNA helicase RecG